MMGLPGISSGPPGGISGNSAVSLLPSSPNSPHSDEKLSSSRVVSSRVDAAAEPLGSSPKRISCSATSSSEMQDATVGAGVGMVDPLVRACPKVFVGWPPFETLNPYVDGGVGCG